MKNMNKKATYIMMAFILVVPIAVLLMLSPVGSHYFGSIKDGDVESFADQIAQNADVTAEKIYTDESDGVMAVLVLDTDGGQHFATYSHDSLFKSRWAADADSLKSYAAGELTCFTTATAGDQTILYGTALPEATGYSYVLDGKTVENTLDGDTILEFVTGTVTDCQLLS